MLRRASILLCNAAIIIAGLVCAFLLRFDFSLTGADRTTLGHSLLLALVTKMIVFRLGGLQRGWWRFLGLTDLGTIFVCNLGASVIFTGVVQLAIGSSFARSIYVMDFVLCFLFTAGTRFAIRFYNEALMRDLGRGGPSDRTNILIYGAGAAGTGLLRDITNNRSLKYEVLGFVDDDPHKHGAVIMGVKVVGPGSHIPHMAESFNRRRTPVKEVIICMPSANGARMRAAMANCRAAGLSSKTLPGIAELISGKMLTGQIRDLSITDLLGRKPVHLDETQIREHIQGKVIMVTGGAGSIGSELCRQIATFRPHLLIIFDQAESEVFRIDVELQRQFPGVDRLAEVGDIRDPGHIEEVIRRHSVQTIFHAAAYKHVPLMEAQVLEAAHNNVIGTWNLVTAAKRLGVAHFIMISSDKAVNPSSIMGATKRITELMVSSMSAAGGATNFVCVRFGNVLGSNGSVIPLFQNQIAAGGPVTVTHPDIRRYFMTAREAAQLVLQASAMGQRGDIFILDMGEPIKIVDLARNMIRLVGLEPDEEIGIRFTGLRPGEKLFEELSGEDEQLQPTSHEKIQACKGPVLELRVIEESIAELKEALERRDHISVMSQISFLVPEYRFGKDRLRLSAVRDDGRSMMGKRHNTAIA